MIFTATVVDSVPDRAWRYLSRDNLASRMMPPLSMYRRVLGYRCGAGAIIVAELFRLTVVRTHVTTSSGATSTIRQPSARRTAWWWRWSSCAGTARCCRFATSAVQHRRVAWCGLRHLRHHLVGRSPPVVGGIVHDLLIGAIPRTRRRIGPTSSVAVLASALLPFALHPQFDRCAVSCSCSTRPALVCPRRPTLRATLPV